MNPNRNARREGQELTLQYRTQQETLDLEDMIEEKLNQLHAFIAQLQHTPPGAADLARRIKLFGKCDRSPDEATSQFYGRLRHWLDRSLPQTRAPRRPPRQADP